MKRLIPTLLAVVILAAGFFYAKSQDFFREPPIEKLPLVEMQLNQVESIYLKLEDDELRMTRAGEEEWKLIRPTRSIRSAWKIGSSSCSWQRTME